jgi:hypothetical protein
MFKAKDDGRYRLEFYFADNGVGWLVTDDHAQAEAWWAVFSKPFHDSGYAARVVSMAMFDSNRYVKEHRHEHKVAA